jgi:hypothetical protein
VATRRQRQKQKHKSASLTDSPDQRSEQDEPEEGDRTSSASTPPAGIDRRTRFERFVDAPAGRGEDQTSPRWLAFVLALTLLPSALCLLLFPLFGPKRLSLEPLEREVTKGAPFLVGAAVLVGLLLFGLGRWLSLPRSQWRFFALAGLATTSALGLSATGYYNARYDHESGYVQSNYRKQAGEGTWAPWIKTVLAKEVYVPAATYRLGCDDHEGTHRCRFRVRGGALGLKWAEPEPMPPGDPLDLGRPFGSAAPAVSVVASARPADLPASASASASAGGSANPPAPGASAAPATSQAP